jgi:hypothetical protein
MISQRLNIKLGGVRSVLRRNQLDLRSRRVPTSQHREASSERPRAAEVIA